MIIDCEQGTPEWHAQRLGKLTASRFTDLLTEPRSKADKAAGKLSQTAESYLLGKAGELLTGEPADVFSTRATEWGTEHEPEARQCYGMRTGVTVATVGFVVHPTIDRVGFSPDGLIGDDGIIEIKCPYTTREHLRNVIDGCVPSQYAAQVQGGLWISGRQWRDFVSYDPRITEHGLDLFVLRVERDEEMIKRIESACIGGLRWLAERFQQLTEMGE